MPQADLSYSADLDFDATQALAVIEDVIKENDPSSGLCKGRAYPIAVSHHSHVLLRLAVLKKPHRNDAFMMGLSEALAAALTPLIPTGTLLNVHLAFLSPYYQSVQA